MRALRRSAPVRSAPDRSAPSKLTSISEASRRMASRRLACSKSYSGRVTPEKSARTPLGIRSSQSLCSASCSSIRRPDFSAVPIPNKTYRPTGTKVLLLCWRGSYDDVQRVVHFVLTDVLHRHTDFDSQTAFDLGIARDQKTA